MDQILILHGSNLNLLGQREPDVYGSLTLEQINERIQIYARKHKVEVVIHQSNHEGELIDWLQEWGENARGIVFNPGGYTHTSVALRDAVASIAAPVIEVHLSNVYAREEFRKAAVIAPVCKGRITGFGWLSYILAIQAILDSD